MWLSLSWFVEEKQKHIVVKNSKTRLTIALNLIIFDYLDVRSRFVNIGAPVYLEDEQEEHFHFKLGAADWLKLKQPLGLFLQNK